MKTKRGLYNRIISMIVIVVLLFTLPNSSVSVEAKSAKYKVISNKSTFVYSGKQITPKITVKIKGKELKKNQYKIKFNKKKRVNVGKYKYTVQVNNKTINKTFTIAPRSTKITDIRRSNNQMIIIWKKQLKQVTGYQIQYSENSSFHNAKKVNIKGNKKQKKSINMMNHKKLYVRIRTYKSVKGKKYYSKWSSSKKVLNNSIKNENNTTTSEINVEVSTDTTIDVDSEETDNITEITSENITEISTESIIIDIDTEEPTTEEPTTEEPTTEEPTTEEPTTDDSGLTKEEELAKEEVEKYNYEVIPVLAPYNRCFYVKSDNPNDNFRLMDYDSEYYKDDTSPQSIQHTSDRYADVKYDDKSKGIVNGGRLFFSNFHSQEVLIDGGEFVVQYKLPGSNTYKDTDIVVTCPKVKPLFNILLERYTDDTMTDTEKLRAMNNGLRNISIYPNYVLDKNETKGVMYPGFQCPTYKEQSMYLVVNADYKVISDSCLLQDCLPLSYTSVSMPSIMITFAKHFDPECTYKQREDAHELCDVTVNGETVVLGGAGHVFSSYSEIFINDFDEFFTFDMSQEDVFTKLTEEWRYNKIGEYAYSAKEYSQTAKDMITGEGLKQAMPNGGWVKCYNGYAYFAVNSNFYISSQRYVPSAVDNAWVDGRYVDDRYRIEYGAKFEDHPLAAIVVTGMDGRYQVGDSIWTFKGDFEYWYSFKYDCWINSTIKDQVEDFDEGIFDHLSRELYLTHEDVEKMQVDRNTNLQPTKGYIYDCYTYPGTPFDNEE